MDPWTPVGSNTLDGLADKSTTYWQTEISGCDMTIARDERRADARCAMVCLQLLWGSVGEKLTVVEEPVLTGGATICTRTALFVAVPVQCTPHDWGIRDAW